MILAMWAIWIWWRRRRMKDPSKEEEALIAQERYLRKVAKYVGIAFCALLVLNTGCQACADGFGVSGAHGWAAFSARWHGLIDTLFWLVVFV